MKLNLFMLLLTIVAIAIALAHPINDNINSDLAKRQDPNLEEKRQSNGYVLHDIIDM
ncbi:23825_t:CDS:2 [Gigaspora margarita]|uniref:23825_t:CDS:1 n=1 Tax=Gigaspora margarita TaxID=4874 RepID=A0ABN7UXM9_GIGMA|nr:23825_t:CDS:2 [Gigaspora margarita]